MQTSGPGPWHIHYRARPVGRLCWEWGAPSDLLAEGQAEELQAKLALEPSSPVLPEIVHPRIRRGTSRPGEELSRGTSFVPDLSGRGHMELGRAKNYWVRSRTLLKRTLPRD